MKRFLSYVEITTKITSFFPFLMTLAYLFYSGTAINPLRTAVFFASMFIFDLTATTINNYVDTKTNHQTLQFKRSTALTITLILLTVSTALGLYLVYLTDIVVLILGATCFICGILYSYGPVPISRQAYGEFFSGFFYGLVIPFIILYINSPKGSYIYYSYTNGSLNLGFKIMPLITAGLLSLVPFCLTANIMLANNICDRERDIAVCRYTLAFFLKEKALLLYAAIYYLAFLSIPVMVILNILSPLSLLTLLLIFPVQKNINTFFGLQDKTKTFILSVKNFIMIISLHILLIFLGSFLPVSIL